MKKTRTFPSWCCQKCGEPIGWLGRLFNVFLSKWHKCKDPLKEHLGI